MTVAIALAALWALGVALQFRAYYRNFPWRLIGAARIFEAMCMASVPGVCVYAARYLP